jgi:YVTN family beta-propeller protein
MTAAARSMSGRVFQIVALTIVVVQPAKATAAPYVYVTNFGYIEKALYTVSVIDSATDEVIADVPVDKGPEGVAVSPDGRTVYVANFGSTTISVIDAATNTVRQTADGFVRPQQIAVSPDGQRLYVSNSTLPGTISYVNAATMAIMDTAQIGLYIPYAIAVSRDGAFVFATTRSSADERHPCIYTCMIPVVILSSSDATRPGYKYVGRSISLALDPDGVRQYVVTNGNRLWSLELAEAMDEWTLPPELDLAPPRGWEFIARRPGTDLLYVSSSIGIDIIDVEKRELVDTIPNIVAPSVLHESLNALAITPDGKKIYVSETEANSVLVIDAATKAVLRRIIVGDFPEFIAIGPENPPFPPPSPIPPPHQCTGDCDGNGQVNVTELTRAIGAALGNSYLAFCSACDRNRDGRIAIDELVAAVSNALHGCASEG